MKRAYAQIDKIYQHHERVRIMPRLTKCRMICAEYRHKIFSPPDSEPSYIVVSVDEMEAMRLCDYEGLEQEVCANQMGVSRGTYQRILYSARHKVTEALTQGKGIVIEGGNYEVADKDCCLSKKCRSCIRK